MKFRQIRSNAEMVLLPITNEVRLCGHATLATAHTLFNILGSNSIHKQFETLSGTLWVKKHQDGICMDFPLNKPEPLTENQQEKYDKLINTITGYKKVKETLFSKSTGKLMIRLEDYYTKTDLQSLSPNPKTLLELNEGAEASGCYCSAHTVSGSYWSEQLNLKELKCRQCSNRGGDLTLRIRDDNRVDIIGKGTTVIEGEINI
ncbi:Phenazine biosynthesis-like domain-containing protein [Armadillidium vulgare]|nr:Phenazine biosynthesis-like domain-containing protein [Armadillidium vulgare]